MTISKNVTSFILGAVVGAAAITLVKTPAFKKGAAKIVSAGMQLKNDASAFIESVKEDAEDITAEAEYNKAQSAPAAAPAPEAN